MLEVEAIAFGVPVHARSRTSPAKDSSLRRHLAPGRTVALLGSSGVGKSTLVNTFAGEELLATQEIREDDGEGRHTTTHRQLVLLPAADSYSTRRGCGSCSCGSRRTDLETFADVEELAAHCRFSDCAHRTEPGCAVQAAIEDGSLAFSRWTSYKKLQRELAHLERRLDKRLQAEERKRWAKTAPRAARTCARRGVVDPRRPRRIAHVNVDLQPTFAAPWVTVEVKAQSAAASSVSTPFGIRASEPWAVFESAVAGGRTVPSTRS